ncbi:MAG: cytochrome P450 [Marinibacterium sp.]|nr:cytochrome P450 [Marinibacterium sp.]
MTHTPPGPAGDGHGALNAQFFQRDLFGFLGQLSEVFGDVVSFDLGGRSCVLVNSAEHAQVLFARHEDDLTKPDFLSASNRGHWGDGLTTLGTAGAEARRALLRPAFQPRAFAGRLAITADCAADCAAGMGTGRAEDDLRRLTARMAFRAVLGVDVDGAGDAVPMAEAWGEDFTAPATGYDIPGFAMTRPRAGAQMPRTQALIRARLADPDAVPCIASDLVRDGIAAGRPWSLGDLTGEIMQMLFAGHLTIPASMATCLRELARRPDVQDPLRREAQAMDLAAPDLAGWLRRSFAMATLREAMRLHPPAPILYRDAVRDFALADLTIRLGQAVWVAPRLLHRDPRYFDDPLRFDPGRFRNGLSGHSRAAYMPFGSGPRICIAQVIAMLQMALALLVIMRDAPHVLNTLN